MTEGSQRWTRMMKFEQNLEAARKQAQEEKEELQLQEEERQATYMEKIRKIQEMQLRQEEVFAEFLKVRGLEQSQSSSSSAKPRGLEESHKEKKEKVELNTSPDKLNLEKKPEETEKPLDA